MGSRLTGLKKGEAFKEKLRVAVFGTGYWSTLQIPAWSEVEDVRIVAAYNRTLEKGKKIADRFHIPKVYDDPEELLKNENIDVMDVIAEIPAHAPLVSLAAKYRIPVICQKPMGPDWETCKHMVDVCRDADIPFFVNENFRWQPPLRAVKDVIGRYNIGKVFRAHIQLFTGGPMTYVIQPFLQTLQHPTITDMGSHVFDLCRFYFGEPDRIYCQTQKTRDFLNGEDVFCAMLRVGDILCTCEVSERVNSRVFIEGTEGTLELRNDNSIIVNVAGQASIIQPDWPRYSWISTEDENLHGSDCIHSIVACQQHLAECLRKGCAAETAGEDNLKTIRLVFAAIESAEGGKVVSLSL